MDPTFQKHVEALPPALDQLLATEPKKVTSLRNRVPKPGVYLLSEGQEHLWVGRAGDIGKRLNNHLGAWRQAAFAFRLAREATGKLDASYDQKGSREALMEDPIFKNAFYDARNRIKNMDARYIEEPNPIRQCLLEVYVHVALGTRYNDFATH